MEGQPPPPPPPLPHSESPPPSLHPSPPSQLQLLSADQESTALFDPPLLHHVFPETEQMATFLQRHALGAPPDPTTESIPGMESISGVPLPPPSIEWDVLDAYLRDMNSFSKGTSETLPRPNPMTPSPGPDRGVILRREHRKRTEQCRRGELSAQMRELRSLVPHCFNENLSRVSILLKTVHYIRELQGELQASQDLNRAFQAQLLHSIIHTQQKGGSYSARALMNYCRDVCSRVLKGHSLASTLKELPRMLCVHLHYDFAALEIYDSRAQDMVIVGQYGAKEHNLPMGFRVPCKQTISGTAARTGQTQVVPDARQRDDYAHPILLSLGCRTFCGAPMTAQGEVVGAVVVGNYTIKTITCDDVCTLEALAVYLGAIIQYFLGRKARPPDVSTS